MNEMLSLAYLAGRLPAVHAHIMNEQLGFTQLIA